MTVEVLENGAERFVTAGGISITRQRHDTAYQGAIETYIDGLDTPPRRGFFLELRISRPLYALGHRHHRPACGHQRARPRDEDRGA